MTRLTRKLLRDLYALKTQALAVALVMSCGLAMMITTRSLILSLETARDHYYRDYRFAQVFARLKRAPQSIRDELAALPGVGVLQTGISLQVTLDLPGLDRPALGLVNSLPEYGELELNRLHLRRGRMLVGPAERGEVLVSEAFADAHHLAPGDQLAAILNGRKQSFRVAGIVLSPEFVFESLPGAALPDNRTYGVLWMPYRELAKALNLYGAFNRVELTLAPGAAERAVIAAVDRVLAPYGGRGAYARRDHQSDTRVTDEIRELQALSIGFPLVFLSVAAFMTNAVMSRLIALQRQQIAVLKAFGFSNRQIGWHYLQFALGIVVAGTLFGAFAGVWLGHRLVGMYHLFFRFPALEFILAQQALAAAAFVSALAAILGGWGAVRAAVRLPPAQAMRPEPPAHYRPALVERTRLSRALSPSFRMALRNIERRPVRAALTCLALALATGVLLVPNALGDGIAYILDYQWDLIQRHTVSISLVEPGPARALADFRHLPGVIRAEPFRAAPVEFRAGNRTRRITVLGFPPEAELDRVVDTHDRQIMLPPSGLVISAKLADILGVRLGEELVMQVLDGKRPLCRVRIAALAEDFAGVIAYMQLDALNGLLGEGDRLNGAYLSVAGGRWAEFLQAVKNTPQVGAVLIKDVMRDSFRQTTAQFMGLLQSMYLAFATVGAFGIVYNSARIALSERERELATLRVIGFTRGEVSAVLVGELVLLTAVALPLGLLLGIGFAGVIVKSINTEFVRLPFVLTPATFAYAILVIAVASVVSAALACRHLNRLDLVGALKAAE